MSDSADVEASRVNKSAAPRVEPPTEVGLRPEEAEKFAAAFVPIWQFDNAPFSAGSSVSQEELVALGAAPSSSAVSSPKPPDNAPPVQRVDATAPRDATASRSVTLRIGSANVPERAQGVARALDSRQAYSGPSAIDDTQEPSTRRRGKGVWTAIGGVAVVAIVGGILVAKGDFLRSSRTTPDKTTESFAPAPPVENHIPPPPPQETEPDPVPASGPATQPAAAATAAERNAPPVPSGGSMAGTSKAPASIASPPTPESPPPPPPRETRGPAPVRSSVKSDTPRASSAPKNSPKSNGSGIVRDNPF